MKPIFNKIIILSVLFSLLFSPQKSVSAAVDNLKVSEIESPSGANGIYTYAGPYSGFNSWSHMDTETGTTYYIYNDEYSGLTPVSRYWNIDTDFIDEGTKAVIFYSKSAASSPVGLESWSLDSGVGTVVVTTETPSAEIAVLGNGYTIADGSTTISSGNFTNIGSANLSGGTASRVFTINNTGSATLSLSGSSPYVTISGTNASNFSVTAAPSQSIAASTGTTTFTIRFTPSFEGYHNAVVTINNNDPDEGIYTFNIQGYGYVAQSIVISGITVPSAVNGTYIIQVGDVNNFPSWKHQTLGYYLYYGIYTDGKGYWYIDNNTNVTQEYFYIESENGTPVGLTGWKVDTTVDPLPTGSPVISYAVLAPEINLKGNSTSIAFNDVTPSFLDHTKFGSVNISAGSRTRTFTIENTGGAALTISGVTLGGADASEFSKTDPLLTTIPANGNTTFTVTIDPSTEGIKTADISIASNDSDENPYQFSIAGDAFIPKNLLVSGIVEPAAANGTYTYQGIRNDEFQYWKHESLEYYIFNEQYSESDKAYYWNIDVDTDDAVTDIDFLFFRSSEAMTPVGLSSWTHNTNTGYVTSGSPSIQYAGSEMDVRGNGISIADGSTTPTTTNATDFSSVSVASGTSTSTFTIYNTGYEDLSLSGSPIVAISGTNSGDFSVTAQPATPVTALTGTTSFTVEFNPSGGGTRSASISIANDDGDENPYNFNIQGTGLTVPTLTTSAATSIMDTSATLGGNITSDGGSTVTGTGVVYSTSDDTPTIGESDVLQDTNVDLIGAFSESIGSMDLATLYHVQAYATNAEGTAYGGVQEFTTLNTVASIAGSGSSPTNANSVSWDVVFDSTVTGLTESNFTLVNTGLTGPAITDVSGSGTAWTVTASTGTGSGTLGLNLTSNTGLNIGLFNIPFTGQVYTIDRAAPSTTSFTLQNPATSPTNVDTLVFRVTFNDEVIGVSEADFAVTGTTAAAQNTDYVSAGVYDVTVSGGNLSSYTGLVGLDFSTGMSITDAVGNAVANTEPVTNETYTVDHTAPTVTNVASTSANKSYTTGAAIPVTVTFDEAVTVTGTPQLTLETGATDQVIDYSSGSGSDTLTFNYTVQAGDTSADLDYLGTTSLALNSGTIRDAANNNAVLTLASPGAAGSLGANKDMVIDTTTPSVTDVTSTSADGAYTSGAIIPVTVTFSEAVTVSGTLQLTLETGTTDRVVNYSSGSGSDTLTFNYTVQAGDTSSDLDYVSPTSLALISGTVADTATNNAALTLASPGSLGSLGANQGIVIDTTAPITSIDTSPSNPSASTAAAFTFSATDTGGSGAAGFECSLDGEVFNNCTSPHNLSSLGDGSHSFQVQAVDNAGNTDATPVSYTWVVDASAPATNILANPSNPSKSTSAAFVFSGNDGSGVGVAGFECKLETGAFSACTSPLVLTSLSDGSQTFQVRATDSLGNVDPTPASYTWTVDTTGPTVVLTSSTADPTNTSPITVTITFSEPVTGFTPSVASGDIVIGGVGGVDGNPQAVNSTTYTFDLAPAGQGAVTVSVPFGSALDTAGNSNSVSNTFSITYDTVSPTVTIEQKTGQADPTSASPINFTVTFNAAVTDFTASDVTLNGTAGATTSVVTGSGTTYNVAVSGMIINGTVIPSIAAGAAHDAASNPNTASTSIDNTVNYLAGPLNVTINQATGQNDPSNSLPVNFTVVFDRPIDQPTFIPEDVTLGGTAPGTRTVVITESAPNNGTTFDIAVSGLTGTGTVTASIAANTVQDLAANQNNASISSDNSVVYDPGTPSISTTSLKVILTSGPTSITMKFNEAVYDNPLSDTETDDVTNPNNYYLLEKGVNAISERTACNVAPSTPSDDVYISIDQVDYDNTTFTATLAINGGVALPVGEYELFVCGTTSIVDLAGNAINNGLSDYTNNFRVTVPRAKKSLPATGFAPDRVTILPGQPEASAYGKADMWIEIPSLGIKQEIVGVPQTEAGWDVSWLADSIGYLQGTAFPTWAGNSVLTGHVTGADGQPGVFADLGSLGWGKQIIIHAYGQKYIYEVRTVDKWSNPDSTRVIEKHEELPWLTLITCRGYVEETGTYSYRTVVRAVQVKVEEE